jgi:DNA-binding transcriptional MocR family regulator
MRRALVSAADTIRFHFFRSMVGSGDVWRLGPCALTVYVVIKAHVNFRTGRSFPSIATICLESGISERQVKRSLLILEQTGYIVRRRVGGRNEYFLREKVQLRDGARTPTASLPYPITRHRLRLISRISWRKASKS